MTREQTSRIDTSTSLFLASTTGIVFSFSSHVNSSDDLLVEQCLAFSLISLVHVGTLHLFLIIFLPLTLSLFQHSLFLLVLSLFLPFLVPHPASHPASLPSSLLFHFPVLFWGHRTWEMGGRTLTEVVFLDWIPPTLFEITRSSSVTLSIS